MAIWIGANGKNESIVRAWVGANGENKPILKAWVGTPEGNKVIWDLTVEKIITIHIDKSSIGDPTGATPIRVIANKTFGEQIDYEGSEGATGQLQQADGYVKFGRYEWPEEHRIIGWLCDADNNYIRTTDRPIENYTYKAVLESPI